MPIDLPPQYDPKSVEKAIYQRWLDARAFHAVPDERGPEKRYSMVIPPPNVTGALHLGHAINGTIQDVLARYHRMKGDNTLWMPGIDHAGIATQAVVEKTIFEQEKKNRHDLGREELVRRIWEWKEQFGTRILAQLASIGASCDWDRTRFTLDEVCAKAVREAFFKMFKDGLIFRGKRLVNWDTHLQTAVADDEIYHETVKGQMTAIRYPVEKDERQKTKDESENPKSEIRDPKSESDLLAPPQRGDSETEYLVVATTRPETMLGDTAVAVHPEDPRYQHLIGKHVILPLVGRRIPVVADGLLVDPKFGTGVVKVTPAHDPNDYATGQRHGLEMINLLTADGKVNENGAGEFMGRKYSYVGLKFATAARKQVLADLEELGLVVDKKVHEHEVGHSDRSKTPIEPYLSDQWFVRMGDIVSETQPSEPRPLGSDRLLQEQPAHSTAAGYFISFHTYATWLHGQEPGSVDPEHNVPGTPFIEPDPDLLRRKFEKAIQPPLILSMAQRESVLRTIQEVADHRGWVLHAANVRTTHVHIVVSGRQSPERMMNDFKSYATRRMREAGLITDEAKVWTRHGSTPYLWKTSDIAGAVDYVLYRQGENTPGTFFQKVAARGSLPNGRGSDGLSGGVTLADGTRASGLAQAAMDAVTSGRVKITPERYAKGYLDWLGQKRDWCISRQLWWGHRIPVWSKRIRVPNEPGYHGKGWWFSELDSVLDQAHPDVAVRIVHVGTGKPIDPATCTLTPELDLGQSDHEFDVYVCALHDDDVQRLIVDEGFVRDPDVLDTWFSSALWPISTMGWPQSGAIQSEPRLLVSDRTAPGPEGSLPHGRGSDGVAPESGLLEYFYPTSLLSTAREILTLWVARMVMFGLYCKGDVPFRDVYIHAIIQDGEGRPMKKTLGNGVDPVDIVHSHGADALRFTLASMATETQDIRLPVQLVCPHCLERVPNNIQAPVVVACPKCKKPFTRPVQTAVATPEAPMSHSTSDRFDLGRNFANKIWNASRFVLSNLGGDTQFLSDQDLERISLSESSANEDKWILARLDSAIEFATDCIAKFNFANLAQNLYRFFWTDFCDWYLEIAKPRIKSGDKTVQSILLHCLDTTLRLLHPIMPFITEEIWSRLPNRNGMIIWAHWPQAKNFHLSAGQSAVGQRQMILDRMGVNQAIISAIREIQNRYPAAKGKEVTLKPRDPATQQAIEVWREMIGTLVGARVSENSLTAQKPEDAAATVLPEVQIFIGGVIDKGAETVKLTKRKAELEKLIASGNGKLANEAFVSKAPAKIIQGLRDQLAKQQEELAAIAANLKELQ